MGSRVQDRHQVHQVQPHAQLAFYPVGLHLQETFKSDCEVILHAAHGSDFLLEPSSFRVSMKPDHDRAGKLLTKTQKDSNLLAHKPHTRTLDRSNTSAAGHHASVNLVHIMPRLLKPGRPPK